MAQARTLRGRGRPPATRASAQPSRLERELAAAGRGSAGPLDALVAARRRFLRGERLDMQEIAAELGINRATLYRWVGDRDHLLGEVLWSLAELGLADARAAAGGTGVDWVVGLYTRFMELTASHGPIRRFVEAEPEAALRVLTSRHGVQQRRLIDAMRGILEEKSAAGELHLRLDPADLAYVMVRVGESFIWREFITGDDPDVARAADVVRVLLS
jgi:AcrR family transcriptional regulator